jgi:tRNA synthetases class I (M)
MTATYITTTTVPYVNARPHIGHAPELVQADVLARYRRGDAVRFQAGTDDNSLKNVLAAEAAGVGVLAFIDGGLAARITAQCTPGGDGRLPDPAPVFRRLADRDAAATGRKARVPAGSGTSA